MARTASQRHRPDSLGDRFIESERRDLQYGNGPVGLLEIPGRDEVGRELTLATLVHPRANKRIETEHDEQGDHGEHRNPKEFGDARRQRVPQVSLGPGVVERADRADVRAKSRHRLLRWRALNPGPLRQDQKRSVGIAGHAANRRKMPRPNRRTRPPKSIVVHRSKPPRPVGGRPSGNAATVGASGAPTI